MGVGALDTNHLWVVDNHIHHNGGDSIQVQQQTAGVTQYIYIGRNLFHDNRENAVDIKQAEHVIISENNMYGFRAVTTSSGDAVVVHYTPCQNIWIINNYIHDTPIGISSGSGPSSVYIINNIINNIRDWAIIFWENGEVYVIGNTLYNATTGISGKNSNALYAYNNIISKMNPSSVHLGVGSDAMATASIASNNLFYQDAGNSRILWGGGSENYYNLTQFQQITGKCRGCLEEDPKFVNSANNNFSLQSNSLAIDSGVESEVYQRFYDLYGIDIRKDIEGRIRPQDGDNNESAEWDIGAYEYTGGIGGASAQSYTPTELPSEKPSLSVLSQIYKFFKGFLTANTIKEITGYFLRIKA
jgi:hypothetical protein